MERAFRAYGKSIENASKKRIKGGKEKDEPMAAVEFVLCCKNAGLTAEEIDDMIRREEFPQTDHILDWMLWNQRQEENKEDRS